ncbi:hypothetical protein R3W88_019684 [Solanum pinnatisectum]|uniref:Uncharacterized protein n=1 Tax=Solanum pinnatisectum TaxID=50273 RepID=A0AAV9KKZ8_9SOLN|nr:hypothetical protein R3W88_019684 [Solanum pinnatisectum]
MNMIFIDEKENLMHGIIRTSKLLKALGDSISPKKNGELISMDMIFIDEGEVLFLKVSILKSLPYFFYQGNLMHGIIRKNQVNRFKDKLSEGFVFIIKNFKIVESIGG